MGWSWVEDRRFAGTAERGCGGTGATLVATLDGADSERDTEVRELTDWLSSSSFDLSSDEISTMSDMTVYPRREYEGEVVAHGEWSRPYTHGTNV